MFKIGDKAVYPAHGVGVIEDIQCKVIEGCKRMFYVLRILEKDMTIMIPKDNAQMVGLREIIQKKDVPKVIRILSEKNGKVDCQTWNRRYREYMEKIKSGSVFEVAEVLRDLYLAKGGKELSFCERKLVDTAHKLLIKELAIAKECDENEIEQAFKKIFEP